MLQTSKTDLDNGEGSVSVSAESQGTLIALRATVDSRHYFLTGSSGVGKQAREGARETSEETE
jgi:putative ribosome biogenesis GTPase RsgA